MAISKPRVTRILHGLAKTGMNQTEIARAVGMSDHKVSRWMRGDPPAGAEEALRLADLLAERQAAAARAKVTEAHDA